jgi:hypothetical protein
VPSNLEYLVELIRKEGDLVVLCELFNIIASSSSSKTSVQQDGVRMLIIERVGAILSNSRYS